MQHWCLRALEHTRRRQPLTVATARTALFSTALLVLSTSVSAAAAEQGESEGTQTEVAGASDDSSETSSTSHLQLAVALLAAAAAVYFIFFSQRRRGAQERREQRPAQALRVQEGADAGDDIDMPNLSKEEIRQRRLARLQRAQQPSPGQAPSGTNNANTHEDRAQGVQGVQGVPRMDGAAESAVHQQRSDRETDEGKEEDRSLPQTTEVDDPFSLSADEMRKRRLRNFQPRANKTAKHQDSPSLPKSPASATHPTSKGNHKGSPTPQPSTTPSTGNERGENKKNTDSGKEGNDKVRQAKKAEAALLRKFATILAVQPATLGTFEAVESSARALNLDFKTSVAAFARLHTHMPQFEATPEAKAVASALKATLGDTIARSLPRGGSRVASTGSQLSSTLASSSPSPRATSLPSWVLTSSATTHAGSMNTSSSQGASLDTSASPLDVLQECTSSSPAALPSLLSHVGRGDLAGDILVNRVANFRRVALQANQATGTAWTEASLRLASLDVLAAKSLLTAPFTALLFGSANQDKLKIEMERLLRSLLSVSTLAPAAKPFVDKAARIALAGVRGHMTSNNTPADVLAPITELAENATALCVAILSAMLKFTAETDGKKTRPLQQFVVDFLSGEHVKYLQRLRYADTTVSRTASFQMQFTQSHTPMLNLMHVALQLLAPILANENVCRSKLDIGYTLQYMRQQWLGKMDALPLFLGDGEEGSNDVEKGDSHHTTDASSRDEQPAASVTFASRLCACVFSILYVAIPPSVNAFESRSKSFQHQIARATHNAQHRDILTVRATEHRLMWTTTLFSSFLLRDTIAFVLQAPTRLFQNNHSAEKVMAANAALEILARVASQVLHMASGAVPEQLAEQVKYRGVVEFSAFVHWCLVCLQASQENAVVAGHIASALYSLILNKRVPLENASSKPLTLISGPGTMIIHQDSVLRALLPSLMAVFEAVDAIIALDVDSEEFPKYEIKGQIQYLIFLLLQLPDHSRALHTAITATTSRGGKETSNEGDHTGDVSTRVALFCAALLNSLLFSLDGAIAAVREVHFAENRLLAKDKAAPGGERERTEQLILQKAAQAERSVSHILSTLDLLHVMVADDVVRPHVLSKKSLPYLCSIITLMASRFAPQSLADLSVKNKTAAALSPQTLALSICRVLARLDDGDFADIAAELERDAEFRVRDFLMLVQSLKAADTRILREGDLERLVHLLGGGSSEAQVSGASEVDSADAADTHSQLFSEWLQTHRVSVPDVFFMANEEQYHDALAEEAFSASSFTDEAGVLQHSLSTKPPGAQAKMLLKEFKKLRRDLPTFLNSAIFVRMDEDHPYLLKALLSGPENTPYAFGLFMFDIYFPAQYPNAPPLMKFLTNGRGRVRMNPNLYNNGSVCLSILNTWHASSKAEKWSADKNLYAVLMSLQTHMFVRGQMYNEPGTENKRQGEDRERSRLDDARVLEGTLRYGIIDMLCNPLPAFADAIDAHFRMCAPHLLRQLERWSHEFSDVKALDELFKQTYALVAKRFLSDLASTNESDSTQQLGSRDDGGDDDDGDDDDDDDDDLYS